MDPHGDCMLAYEMNGVPVPGDHGYPVRALNPGTIIIHYVIGPTAPPGTKIEMAFTAESG